MPRTKKMRRAMNLRPHLKQQQPVSAYMHMFSIFKLKVHEMQSNPSHIPQSPPLVPTPPDAPTTESFIQPTNSGVETTPSPSSVPLSKRQPPPREFVRRALPALEERTNPKRKSGVGHKKPNLTALALKDLSSVVELFRTYTSKEITWVQASIDTALAKGHGKGYSRTLRTWGRACLQDPSFTPRTSYGQSNNPIIDHDEFREQLQIHLREAGKYVTTADVIQFTGQPEILERWGLTKAISKTTARRWMLSLDYRWRREQKGMYLDGHERQDVVDYRQNVFLRRWKDMEPRMQSFATFGTYVYMDPIIRRIVAWFHDECTFRANDRRMLQWVLLSASRKPIKKGEGDSLMVSDIVSAEHGWMCSPDG
jgi:hypothetical protein